MIRGISSIRKGLSTGRSRVLPRVNKALPMSSTRGRMLRGKASNNQIMSRGRAIGLGVGAGALGVNGMIGPRYNGNSGRTGRLNSQF